MVWASLQRGGWVPRASFSRENEPDGSHFTFYIRVSEVLQYNSHCFYSGEGIDSVPDGEARDLEEHVGSQILLWPFLENTICHSL